MFFSQAGVVRTTIVVLGLGLLVETAGLRPASAGEAQGQVTRGDKLTKQQFEALPDSAVIEFKGKRMPKSEIRARAAKGKEAMAKVPAAATKVRDKFEQRRAQFEQKQQAKLAADNQKVNAEFAKLNQDGGSGRDSRRAAIENEARELSVRYKTASAAEKVQIDRRAGE
ncbi:MAG TPA: hypothetical protein VGA73_07805, partial [Candidatus Binatia bacterium]